MSGEEIFSWWENGVRHAIVIPWWVGVGALVVTFTVVTLRVLR
jgi:hypothetical protein